MFYVYLLIDPRTNRPFYVGKGKNRRAWVHIQPAQLEPKHNRNPFKASVIKKMMSEGVEPTVVLFADELTEDQSLELEVRVISHYGMRSEGGCLTNLHQGGARGAVGYRHSETTRAKMSRSRLGKPSPARGRIQPLSERLKRAESMRGHEVSEETRQKLRASNIGKTKHSSANREAQRHRALNMSAETRDKIRNTLTGTTHSEDRRQKQSAAIKEWWRKRKLCEV